MPCSSSIFGVLKRHYRKPIQQQPFHNYSSILYTHHFSKNQHRNLDVKQNLPRIRPTSRPTKTKEMPTKRTTQIPLWKSFRNSLANQRRWRRICAFKTWAIWKLPTITLANFRQIILGNQGHSSKCIKPKDARSLTNETHEETQGHLQGLRKIWLMTFILSILSRQISKEYWSCAMFRKCGSEITGLWIFLFERMWV